MMKRLSHIILIALVLVWLLIPPFMMNGAENVTSNEPILYSAKAMREDLTFLYKNLQISSYDLFLNTSKTEYDNAV